MNKHGNEGERKVMRELGRIFTKPTAGRKMEGLEERWGGQILFPFTIMSGEMRDRDRGSCRNRGCRDRGQETVIVSL